MAKLTFLILFVVCCIFSVSYSRILPPASSSLDVDKEDEVSGLEQGLVNYFELIDQENENRKKRSPQDLPRLLGSINGILSVTSALANAFNATRQVFERFRNLTQRICIDCRNNTSSPVVSLSAPTDDFNYDDYYDYNLFDVGRKKRDVDSENNSGSNKDRALDREKRLVSSVVVPLLENFINQEIMKQLQNVGSALRDQIGFISERAKFVVANFFDYIRSMFG